MLVKSSAESIELAYDTANIVYKRVGPTYDKWWMKEGYGQNYAWVVAEHSDYSVRLFFEFMDTGFCYVKVHFTNGASYEDLIADSWNYAKESPEYPFEETCDHVRNFLDNFFEVGGGMDKLRAKYEKGNNSYDVDSYIEKDGYVKNSRKSSRRAIKSGRRQEVSNKDFINKLKSMKSKGWSTSVVGYYENDLDTDEQRLYVSGGEYTFTNNDDERRKLSRQIMALNGGEGIGYKKRNFEDVINSSRRPVKSSAQSDYDKGADYAEEQYQKYVEGGIDAEDIAAPADCSNDFFNGFNDKILEYKISSSRKPVKSSAAPDGLTFDSRYDDGNYSYLQYKVNNNNILNIVKEYLSYDEDELQPGNVYINLMYDDSDTLVAGQVVDTENSTWDLSPEECVEIFGSDIMTYLDPGVGKHAVDEFTDYDVDPETVKSSRKPIKSANYNGFNLEARRSYGKGNGYFTTYPVWDTDLDTSIGAIEYHYAVENPYYVAWVYNDFGANKTGRTKAFDTEEECLEWIGEELASGTTARDKLLKYWEELGYDYKSKNLNNSRKPVKSSFIVGKQDNGTKVYFCEDGKYYSENDYSRPSIKIFNNKSEADKIAKRSKNGFVSPLEK